jgi:hypothetical protein
MEREIVVDDTKRRSDADPIPLLAGNQHLQKQYRDAAVIGAVAAKTPFITGLPHTLFFNDQVHDIALTLSNGRPLIG